MKLNDARGNSDSKAHVCPFLGLKDDPETALSFASSHNHCFHAKPVLPVRLDFQRTYCLKSNHTNCEEFNRKGNTPLLPKQKSSPFSGQRINISKTSVWILLLGSVAIVLIAWQVLGGGLLGSGTQENLPKATQPAFLTEVGLQTPTVSPTQIQNTPTATTPATALPTQIATPTISSPHALETPIGVAHKLIIHRAEAGESLMSVASRYWTTVEAIQAINYYLPTPLQIGALIIVPVNQTDVTGLPAFDAFEVNADISVGLLAQQLSVDTASLELYNGFGNGESLYSGEWVIVPHISKATP
jgi:hypothetical protein